MTVSRAVTEKEEQMKAAVYDNPGVSAVLEYVDMPDPVCGQGDVLIAVEAISIEGGDLINRRSTKQQSRWIVGYAAAGTIVAVGENVRNRTVGEKWRPSTCKGSHAELWAVPGTRTWLVPDGLSMAEAAVVPISFGAAYHCVITKGQLKAEEAVLIHAAADGLGIAAVQLARQAGAKVIRGALIAVG
ncbi:Zn-dependent alcohol dehydrogenase domain-containing protein (plasmid) [Rhizobium sp. N324]|nr:Zn-dependent alcohol dehydrogenase domain-containing protein [Rhizobium sp. N324]OYD01091.1 Zn-dependent alcohol dehydrogenase domain-containing protein [Rhizobium sp. N4311]